VRRTAPPSAHSDAGSSEFGIHLAYCQAAGQDANDLPYGNIIALNEHGAVLHYTDRDRMPPKPVAQLS
jgi:Xaa-Pro dipeptidase